uniref:Thioesterase domain-containing protein n=1 Tax=Mycena chlorophos TaxID=658473 RepID=A0ABQ0M7B7_MYCCL|nr:predicted protein [Mycena chlorophos]
MHYILCKLTTIASRYPFRAPTIPIVFNVLGNSPRSTSQGTAELGLFDQGIGRLMAVAPQDIFIELGPHTSCLPILKANPAVRKDALLLGSLRKQQQATPVFDAQQWAHPQTRQDRVGDASSNASADPFGAYKLPSARNRPRLHPTTDAGRSWSLAAFIHPRRERLVNYYDRLAFLDWEIWGIPDRCSANAAPWKGLVDVAGAYLDYILERCLTGPLLLGGCWFSGFPAYEIALQLTVRNIQVKGILLIDVFSPIIHVPLSELLIDRVLKLDAINTPRPTPSSPRSSVIISRWTRPCWASTFRM